MKEKMLRLIKIIQIGASSLLFSLVFFSVNNFESGLILPDSIAFLPALFYILFIVLFGIDFYFKKANIRLLIYYIEIVLVCTFLAERDFYLANSLLMITGLLNTIVTIVALVKEMKNETNYKTLPIGIFSYGHFYGIYVPFALIIGLIMVLSNVFPTIGISRYYLLLSIPLVIIWLILFMIFTNPVIKALKAINKNLDYDKYNSIIDSLMPNNLNPESRAYLETIRANYMLLDNKEEALKYYETVSTVTAKQFIVQYAIVKANFAAMMHDGAQFGNAISLINTYGRKNKDKVLMIENAYWKVFNSNDLIENIEEIFDVNAPIPISRIDNKNMLMYYYDSRGFKDKALVYANELKDCPFNEIKKSANKILEVKENEE